MLNAKRSTCPRSARAAWQPSRSNLSGGWHRRLCRRLEDQRTKAGGFKNDVKGSMHLACFSQRHLLLTDIVSAKFGDEIAVKVRWQPARVTGHLHAPQAHPQGRKEANRARADHRRTARLPDFQAPLDLIGLVPAFLCNTQCLY